MLVGYSRPARAGEIKKLPVASVPIEEPSLLEFLRGVSRSALGIHVTVADDQVFPPIVVDIQKCGAPSKMFGVYRQSGSNGRVVEVISAQISVQSVRVVRKVSLENIQQPVMIEVACRHAHSCLFAAVFVVGDARLRAYLLKTLATEVVAVQVWRGIAGHIDVRPSVVVTVGNHRSETVTSLRSGDMNLVRNIREVSVAIVLIQGHRFRRQSTRPAYNRQPLPLTLPLITLPRSLFEVDVPVVNHHEVLITVSVEVEEAAAGAPPGFCLDEPALLVRAPRTP